MGKYKVLVIAHSIKDNKIAAFGDLVDETQLNSPADELVEAGFIELVEGDEEVDAENIEVVEPTVEVVKETLKPKK